LCWIDTQFAGDEFGFGLTFLSELITFAGARSTNSDAEISDNVR
jgi:hypothetical protein